MSKQETARETVESEWSTSEVVAEHKGVVEGTGESPVVSATKGGSTGTREGQV